MLALSLVLGLGAGVWIPSAAVAQVTCTVASVTAAAKAGTETMSFADVGHALSVQLAKIEQQRHQLLEQKLDQFIGNRFLAHDRPDPSSADRSAFRRARREQRR